MIYIRCKNKPAITLDMCGIWGYIGRTGSRYMSNRYSVAHPVLYDSFQRISHRGPDGSSIKELPRFSNIRARVGFHQLNITGNRICHQPMSYEFKTGGRSTTSLTVANAEIFNIASIPESKDLRDGDSDCGVLPRMLASGKSLHAHIEGEYAFASVATSHSKFTLYAGTDHLGIRPLFYAQNDDAIGWSSEVKGLLPLFSGRDVRRLPPSSVLKTEGSDFDELASGLRVKCAIADLKPLPTSRHTHNDLRKNIRDTLITCVKDTIMHTANPDRDIGYLLSGGLDSSIVCALASRVLGPGIRTFSVGLPGSTDMEHALCVAAYLGTDHTHVECSVEEFLAVIPEVIHTTETYDVTTIRASVGQFLLGRYIAEHLPDVKVLVGGDGSDEVCSGYLYSHFAPSPQDLEKDGQRLLAQIHLYDALRADRCMAAHGLETRFPFLDRRFVSLYTSIDPVLRQARPVEKALLRQAFSGGYLPESVLWRQKEAFSDGVSPTNRSWFQHIQSSVQATDYTGGSGHALDSEKMYYMSIFDKMFPDCRHLIPGYWTPQWTTETDPSARKLVL